MVFIVVVILVAGAVGGIVNALITDNGFPLPRTVTADGGTIVRPGIVGNVLIGAIAALVLFALYGPLKSTVLSGLTLADVEKVPFTFADLGGAIVTGIGGARVLTGEVDKRLLQMTAEQAEKNPPTGGPSLIAGKTPAAALEAVMPRSAAPITPPDAPTSR